ncbi:MAG: restriction endonuclease subunit S [Selenomonas ruminantium]|jgi:type I restriction enzyme S subunit|uniref:Restriction endonuclease subunit S n=2 Tax=Selenomonas ruminantium TaxID=971 RepID=A0A927ZN23_SELRU|nr:restriction endonuclease subunit S [Selenomonas ruminantium]
MRMPKLRFKGFTDDWEQRKLGDIVSFSKGSGYSKSDLQEDGTPIILYGRLYTKYETVISDVDTFASEKSNSVFSNGGEVIVPASGETAEDISVASVVDQPGVILGGDLNIITPPQELDSAFLAISISNGKPHSDMAKMAQGKSVVHLHNSDLAKINLPYPSYEEQRQISHQFKSLDYLIALHQRKCDELQKVKKYMLQKMFPKKGEKVPEIRFAGFTDDWEQRKISDMCSISTGKSNTQDKVDDGEYPFYVRSPIIERSTKYLYDEEAVLTVGDGVGTGKVFHYVNGKYDLHQRCYRMYDFTDALNAKYFYHVFSKLFYNRVMSMTAKTSVDSVRMEMIADMKIPTPNIKEQEKVEAVFTNLDNLITLHQRKHETLKEIKKYMLQNMFPEK